MPPGLSTLKRGSIQVQRAAKVVNGKRESLLVLILFNLNFLNFIC